MTADPQKYTAPLLTDIRRFLVAVVEPGVIITIIIIYAQWCKMPKD